MITTLHQNSILLIKDVISITRLSKATIYRYINDPKNDFPRPLRLGVKRIGWRASSIENYLSTRELAKAG